MAKANRSLLDVLSALDSDSEVPGTSKASPGLVLKLNRSGADARGTRFLLSAIYSARLVGLSVACCRAVRYMFLMRAASTELPKNLRLR